MTSTAPCWASIYRAYRTLPSRLKATPRKLAWRDLEGTEIWRATWIEPDVSKSQMLSTEGSSMEIAATQRPVGSTAMT